MHQNCHAIEALASIVTLGVYEVLVGMPRRLGVQAVSVVLPHHLREHHRDHAPEHPPPRAGGLTGDLAPANCGAVTTPGVARVKGAAWARFI